MRRLAPLALFSSLLSQAAGVILPPAPQDITAVVGQSYDYIINGGGTAGLTLAVLLSQDPNTSVLVIDRGTYRFNDTKMLAPGLWTAMLGDPTYDYVLLSVPQPSANGSVIEFSRGKTLGGTSALNSMVYMPPSRHEFETVYPYFGNAEWSYDNFMAFARMSEHYTPAPSAVSSTDNCQQGANLHGEGGPLQVAYANYFPNLVPLFFGAMNAVGIAPNPDPRASGTNVGSFSAVINVDPTNNQRSWAVSAFYQPNQARSNLVIVTEAQTTEVLFSDPDSTGNLTATGVTFLYANATQTVNAKKSVILSASCFFTPQILELSGVGNKTFLESMNITSKIDLPGVGENLQDHFAFSHAYTLANGSETFDSLRDPTVAANQLSLYIQNRTGLLGAGETAVGFVPISTILNASEIQALQQQIEAEIPSLNPLQQVQYKMVMNWLNDTQTAHAEVFPQFEWAGLPGAVPPTSRPIITTTTLMEHPLSRGSVHIKSTNPADTPAIDPRIYSHPIDKQLAIATLKWTRDNVMTAEPLKDHVTGVFYPPADATDDEIFTSLIDTVITGHSVGTTAMAPRELNGVVDPNLKVYGTNNLYIVDTGVLPMEVSSHLDAFMYTFAYRTAAYLAGNSTTPAGTGSGKKSAAVSFASVPRGTVFGVVALCVAYLANSFL